MELVDPLEKSDWDNMLREAGDTSFFHSAAWARTLCASYGYKPAYLVGKGRDSLDMIMPVMIVSSPWTGTRGVSLPFTDSCEPFCRDERILPEAVDRVLDIGRKSGWRHVEWRGLGRFAIDVPPSETFLTHAIDLARDESALFAGLDESNRRNIRKAGREKLEVRLSQKEEFLGPFFRLNCLTRRRHGLPPQPYAFVRNVFREVIARGHGLAAAAVLGGRVIAVSIYFHFGSEAVFKYGVSDLANRHVRPNNLVMWEAIRWYRENGYKVLRLGRTDPEDAGLLRYKRAWGGSEETLRYNRYSFKREAFLRDAPAIPTGALTRRLFAAMPGGLLRLTGRLIYRHFG